MFIVDATGGGWPALWSARLMGAQFAQNWQSMHLYKSNNMGENLALELFSFGRAPGLQFNLMKTINITCKLLLNYYYANIEDDIAHTTHASNQVFINSNLLINWAISSDLALKGSYRRQTTYDGISHMHSGYIMRNYRQFDRGLDFT